MEIKMLLEMTDKLLTKVDNLEKKLDINTRMLTDLMEKPTGNSKEDNQRAMAEHMRNIRNVALNHPAVKGNPQAMSMVDSMLTAFQPEDN